MKKTGIKMMFLVGVVLVLACSQAFARPGKGKRKAGKRTKIARYAGRDVDGRGRMHHRGDFDGDKGRMHHRGDFDGGRGRMRGMYRMGFRDRMQGVGRRPGRGRGLQRMRRGEGRRPQTMCCGKGRWPQAAMRRGEGRGSQVMRRGDDKSKGFRTCRGCPKRMGKAMSKGPMARPGRPKRMGKKIGRVKGPKADQRSSKYVSKNKTKGKSKAKCKGGRSGKTYGNGKRNGKVEGRREQQATCCGKVSRRCR